jgi:hypothetical protein
MTYSNYDREVRESIETSYERWLLSDREEEKEKEEDDMSWDDK